MLMLCCVERAVEEGLDVLESEVDDGLGAAIGGDEVCDNVGRGFGVGLVDGAAGLRAECRGGPGLVEERAEAAAGGSSSGVCSRLPPPTTDGSGGRVGPGAEPEPEVRWIAATAPVVVLMEEVRVETVVRVAVVLALVGCGLLVKQLKIPPIAGRRGGRGLRGRSALRR